MRRSGAIRPIAPTTVFDVSDLSKAFLTFSSTNRMGKVVIDLSNEQALVRARPRKYATIFSPHKTYVLVGCLGGLGGSISNWMVKQGAKHLLFLGRSGASRPTAQALVRQLEGHGVDVKVVKGDVAQLNDVERAVETAEFPIGGVIHAAMNLEV